jgi:hypothetical protein
MNHLWLAPVFALLSLPAKAAVIFSLHTIQTPADLLSDGAPLFAINAGGDPVTVNGIAFTSPGFGFDPPVPPFDAQWAASGDDFFTGFLSSPQANAALDALYANAYVGTGTRTLTLSPLIPGEPYRLQLFIGDDSLAPRGFGITLLGETFGFSRALSDPAQAVVAQFVATSAAATVTFSQPPGGNPIALNAVALHHVPEPSSVVLAIVGIGALAVRRWRRSLVAACLACLPGTSQAALEWERTLQEFRSSPAQESVRAGFPFKNTGSTTVTIVTIRSSCGCTAAQLQKRQYAPGESGEIVAEFRFGGRRGMQEKTVTVATDEPGAAATHLVLRVAIEEPLTVQPALVFWRLGEAPAPKRIELRAAPERPVRVTGVESTMPDFATQLETVKAGEHYALIVEPKTTEVRAAATFKLATAGTGAAGAVQVFAIVR